MPKLKVLLVCDILIRDYDGCNRTLFHILDRYDKDKIKISIISGKIEGLDQPTQVLKLPNLTLPFNQDYSIAVPYFVTNEIHQFIDEVNPDIVHITSPSLLGSHIQCIAQKRRIPVSSIYHTDFIGYISYYVSQYNPLKELIKHYFSSVARKFYNGCDVVFAPTAASKDYLIDMGIDESRISIWQRGIDPAIFRQNEAHKSTMLQAYNIQKPIVFFASRLVWEKNLETLIAVYKLSVNQGNKYQFVVGGDGLAFDELKEQMPEAIFLGNLTQDELSKWYNNADVFIFPSITETFGNVIIEAMSCGLPVVAANGGGSVSLINHLENGVLVTHDDATSYFHYIEKVLNDAAFRSRLVENGLIFSSKLSWPVLVDSFFESITRIAKFDHFKKVAS
ncbi:MAG TPA: glycosyltransferase [Saprospiraceae bacterium]|nr:glycosyltransferase [Saprospiraceae bacterium]